MAEEVHHNFLDYQRWIQAVQQLFQHTADVEERYHEPNWLQRFVRLLLPGRVSRIHLYEAQERYLYLCRVLDYQERAFDNDQPEQRERKSTVEICRKILREGSVLLTRRQNDLNFLWRDLTRVHIMLLEQVFPDRLLLAQLDFCREEAYRLGMRKDPEVSEMLQRLAEVLDEQGQNRERVIRALRALLERFATIRTDRIHQQFINIRTYLIGLLILVPITLLLIDNADLVLERQNPPTTGSSFPAFVLPENWDPVGLGLLGTWLHYLCAVATHVFQTNILAFVFFAGLTGGFFSVVIRLRNRDLVPGEDVYFLWYVLTKPFVGALGAVVLFILLQAGLVSSELVEPLTQKALNNSLGPEVFGFAFLAGFSERLVFPNLRG